MADINAIVKELWQKTYRNQDIDYIQVRLGGRALLVRGCVWLLCATHLFDRSRACWRRAAREGGESECGHTLIMMS